MLRSRLAAMRRRLAAMRRLKLSSSHRSSLKEFGGDKFQIPDTPSKNGRILSTLPNDQYGFLQGTSMASPHVAAVAALLKSTHPWATPAQLQALLKAQADNPGCPTGPYDGNGDGVVDATCVGGKRGNGFYGFGIVDALRAVK